MKQEQFPESASLRTPFALLRNQGSVLACTAFGPIAAIDTILQRAGHNVNLSTRLVWYILRGQTKGVEATARVLQTQGTCLESLCPYDTALLNELPSGAAWADAKQRVLRDLRPIPIAGPEGLKRAIGQGSPVTFTMVNGNSTEHVSCIDGYGPHGLDVWDSIGAALTLPWADVESGGRITQMVRWGGLPLVPAQGYIEGDTPTLIDGVLSLPRGTLWIGFNSKPKSLHFKNIRLRILDRGKLASGDSEVRDIVYWHSDRATLYIPKLIDGSTILHNVTMERPVAEVISAEEAHA